MNATFDPPLYAVLIVGLLLICLFLRTMFKDILFEPMDLARRQKRLPWFLLLLMKGITKPQD